MVGQTLYFGSLFSSDCIGCDDVDVVVVVCWEVVEMTDVESAEEERLEEIDPHVDDVSNPGTPLVPPEHNNAEAVPFPNAGMELLLHCLTNPLPLPPLMLLLLLLLSKANDVDKLLPSPCVVGGQNRTRLFDRDLRGLISSRDDDDDDRVRGCDRPRDRCVEEEDRPLDCLTINSSLTNPSPTDPTTSLSFLSSSLLSLSSLSLSSPLILILFSALQTELAALEHVLLLSNEHIGHESNNAFHSFVRGDRRWSCTKGW